jgi:lipopolysaccharide transport system permease protein
MANRGHRWPLLAELLRRELTERYQGSLLGWAWALLQPLAQLAVLSLVFTHLLPARASGGTLPYAVFLALGRWSPMPSPGPMAR